MTEKVDITDQVYGKLNGEDFLLYFKQFRIGEVTFVNQKKEYVLVPGYTTENHRIYKIQPKAEPVTQFVEGCDLGWC